MRGVNDADLVILFGKMGGEFFPVNACGFHACVDVAHFVLREPKRKFCKAFRRVFEGFVFDFAINHEGDVEFEFGDVDADNVCVVHV